jgi:DNA repair protein RadA/Sms
MSRELYFPNFSIHMFICSNCQATSAKWTGKCPTCAEWNTFLESKPLKANSKISGGKILETSKIDVGLAHTGLQRYESASGELDSVLGGGLSAGSLVLLSGEPGIGKSTLALQMAEWYSSNEQ